MHVSHVVAHPPFREGTGTACYYNATALRRLGCQVTVYTPRWRLTERDERLAGYEYMRTWLAVENAFLTPALRSIRNTDILHLHYPFVFGAEMLLSRRKDQTPLVMTYHNDLIGGGLRRPAFFLYNRLVTPSLLRRASKIAVTSLDHATSTIFGATLLGERRRDVVEVGNGVDTEAFHPGVDPAPVRIRHNLDGDELVLLYVAHLDRAHVRKGLSHLLRTLGDLRDVPFKLLVVGDGELRSTYEAQARQLALAGCVIFVGRVTHETLPAYYAAADVVVLPSRPPESFGLAVVEGMASGRPVIASDIPGVRTVVVDGETGFLVDPSSAPELADRLRVLAWDGELRRALGDRGRHRVEERYSWHRVAERLMDIYAGLLHA